MKNAVNIWKKIKPSWIAYTAYWAAFAFTLAAWAKPFGPFSDSLTLILSTAGFWIANIIIWNAILGSTELVARIYSMVSFLLAIPALPVNFLINTRAGWEPWLRKVSGRLVYVLAAITLVSISFLAKKSTNLNMISTGLWLMIAFTTLMAIKAVLSPERLVSSFQNFMSHFSDAKLPKGDLISLDGFGTEQAGKLKHAHTVARFVGKHARIREWFVAFSKIFSGPKAELGIFSTFFTFIIVMDLLFFSGILRIEHLLAPKGALVGSGFNGGIADYFYVAATAFVGAVPIGIKFVSNTVDLPVLILHSGIYVFAIFAVIGLVTVNNHKKQTEMASSTDETRLEMLEMMESMSKGLESKVMASSQASAHQIQQMSNQLLSKIDANRQSIERSTQSIQPLASKVSNLESKFDSRMSKVENEVNGSMGEIVGSINQVSDEIAATPGKIEDAIREHFEKIAEAPLPPEQPEVPAEDQTEHQA